MFRYILIGLSLSSNIFAQADMTSTYNDYVKINENAKRIKDSKIKRSISIIVKNSVQDTVNMSYYDYDGRIIDESNLIPITSGSESRGIYQKYSYKYDEFGRVIEKTDSSGSGVKRITVEYEDNGDIEKEEVRDSKNKLLKEISHEYDNLGRIIESNEADLAGNCKSKKQYAYDSYNNMASYKLTSNCKDSAYRSIGITYLYKYDNKSNIIEKNSLHSDKSFKTESFTYGPNGKLSQSYILTGNDQYTVYVYYYDNSNFLTKTERTEVNGEHRKKFSKSFKYDKSGNLLEVSEQNESGDLLYQIIYVYEYY